MEKLIEQAWQLVTLYGLKIIAAIVVLIVGRWVARMFEKIVKSVMGKRDMDPTIVSFIGNLTYFALLTFVVLAALGQLGVQTTSFIAVIGAAGLAIGLALQGSLANFAAGFLMIIFRPFKVGDFIEGAGTAGTVEEIQIFTTQLKTPDNKTIIIPNAKLTEDNITNYSTKGTRRVDMVFGIGYGDDIKKAQKVLEEIVTGHDLVLKTPEPVIRLNELADSSVNFVVRPWSKTSDYWAVKWDITEQVKQRFDKEGISIPFPQRDVHVHQVAPA